MTPKEQYEARRADKRADNERRAAYWQNKQDKEDLNEQLFIDICNSFASIAASLEIIAARHEAHSQPNQNVPF